MKKSDLKLLERIFAHDVESAIGGSSFPYQSRSKQYERLEKEGYIKKSMVILPGRFPVTITGWDLTLLGHATYCMSCDDKASMGEG